MSTHSDAYTTCLEVIQNQADHLIISAVGEVSAADIKKARSTALHEFVNHSYIEHGMTEDEADELHAMIDKEMSNV